MKLLNAISSPTEVGNRENVVFLSKSNKKSATYKSHETLVVQILPTEVVDTENVSFPHQ